MSDHSLHVPVEPVPIQKMDTPVGLFRGACCCGWLSDGFGGENDARRMASQHVLAKNLPKILEAIRPGWFQELAEHPTDYAKVLHHLATCPEPFCVNLDRQLREASSCPNE